MKTRRRKKTRPVKQPFTVVELDDVETVCHVCEAEFLDEADLKLHVAQVHFNEPNGKTICMFCYTILCGGEEFVSHFIYKHLENLTFCYYCYRAFADPVQHEQHELKHYALDSNTSLNCSQCSNIFTNRLELQNHEYKEHRNVEDGFMLNNFFSLLSSALNVNINKFIDYLCKKTPFTCRKCGNVSSNVSHYIEHLKIQKCQSFACDKCFNVYKKKNSIVLHTSKQPQCQKIFLKKNIQRQCPNCENYYNVEDITSHKKSCSVIKCSTCNKYFNSMYELTDHRMEEHRLKVSLRMCKFCKKQFIGTLSLRKHMQRAHKDRSLYKYNCVYCGSIFTHPSKLFAHFFTRHKYINPYTCKICNKDFRLRKHFTIHIKLIHKSIGFVEFDKNLHAIFTDKKSEHPIAPKAYEDIDNTTDASDSNEGEVQEKQMAKTDQRNKKHSENKDTDTENAPQKLEFVTDTISQSESQDGIILYNQNDLFNENETVDVEVKNVESSSTPKHVLQQSDTKIDTVNSCNQLSNDSDDEPLSNIKYSLLKDKTKNIPNLRKKMSVKDKREKLTCKICNKYCYTVQNYHHHLTLHQKTRMKRCIKCLKFFKSRKELKNHMDTFHSSSKLTETLKSLLEKRKKTQPSQKISSRPGESFKLLLEKRKRTQLIMAQNRLTNKFRRTIKKVVITDDCVAKITPMTDHGLSVKKFIENFKPESECVNICNNIRIKAMYTPVHKEPIIKLTKFNHEAPADCHQILRFPVKFKDAPADYINTKVTVKLVQELITNPKPVNMTLNERIPPVEEIPYSEEYCNMFADETDYTQYKNDAIPEVGHEVMLQDTEDIPRTRRLEQEIIIPKIPKKYGGVRIGHLLPQAPFYKIVEIKKLLNPKSETEIEDQDTDKNIKLPDGTQLISIKNPYAHLIRNEHLEEILKVNRNRYYTPKAKNIEKALVKALNEIKPQRQLRIRKKYKKDS